MWQQIEFSLTAKPKGFHLITMDILRHINIPPTMTCGLLHLFIKHTSASLTINENSDPTVRHDLEAHFNQFIPEEALYYQHTIFWCYLIGKALMICQLILKRVL
jgi:secondary thiamine-phosphate synthase enzyme